MSLPLWRKLGYVYAIIASLLEPDKLREFDNILDRDPRIRTSVIPGIPIPSWMGMADLPPESLYRVDPDNPERPPLSR